MRISDWSSDVCSSDLFSATLRILFFRAGPQDFPYDPRLTAPLAVSAGLANGLMFMQVLPIGAALVMAITMVGGMALATRAILRTRQPDARSPPTLDRKSVASGKRVSVRVDRGGRRYTKKQKEKNKET